MNAEKISDGKYNFTFDYSNAGVDSTNFKIEYTPMIKDDLQQIADDYNYRIEPISVKNAKMFRIKKAIEVAENITRIAMNVCLALGKTSPKYSRNLNRKPKTHFKK